MVVIEIIKYVIMRRFFIPIISARSAAWWMGRTVLHARVKRTDGKEEIHHGNLKSKTSKMIVSYSKHVRCERRICATSGVHGRLQEHLSAIKIMSWLDETNHLSPTRIPYVWNHSPNLVVHETLLSSTRLTETSHRRFLHLLPFSWLTVVRLVQILYFIILKTSTKTRKPVTT